MKPGTLSKGGLVLGICAMLMLSGCSSFDRDWRRAGQTSTAAASVEGRWEGTWQSDADHHHGKLRCLLNHETNSLYRARFKATYAGLFKFGYTAKFEMQPHTNLGWEFNGDANLGKLWGNYYYEGRATPTNLASIYRSKYDHGSFDLRRPWCGIEEEKKRARDERAR